MLEFAITGALGLTALAFLIQIGLTLNYQQEIEQQTFRLALATAQRENDAESRSIQYQHFRDRQMVDPSEGFGIMPRALTQTGATVVWGEYLTFLADDRDSESRIIFQLNREAPREFRASDFKAKEGESGDEPTVKRIERTMTSRGSSYQHNRGSGLNTTTQQDMALILKTGDRLTSRVTKNTKIDF